MQLASGVACRRLVDAVRPRSNRPSNKRGAYPLPMMSLGGSDKTERRPTRRVYYWRVTMGCRIRRLTLFAAQIRHARVAVSADATDRADELPSVFPGRTGVLPFQQ